MIVSFFADVRSVQPLARDLTWERLADTLVEFRAHWGDDDASKRSAPCWSPVRYREGGRRRAADVVDVSALVLDYDDGRTIDEAVAAWDGLARVVHTSWSHSPEAHKLRVILPLVEPVPASLWSGVYRAALRDDGDVADPKCSDPSRLYLLPCMGRHAVPWARCYPGDLLDLGDLALRVDEARRRVEAAQAERRARVAREAKRYADQGDTVGAVRRLLDTDPHAREALGQRLGGSVIRRPGGDVIKGIRCPSCGRLSLWWFLAPLSFGGAACDHRKSCGYAAPLWHVAEGA